MSRPLSVAPRRAVAVGIVFGLLAAPAFGAGKPAAKAAPAAKPAFTPSPDDRAVGNPKAKVTLVEYASVGCPHCAHWDNEVFDDLKAKYIDTGQVRFVYREIITGDPTLAAAGFMIARCAAPDEYFAVVRNIYRQQQDIIQSGELRTRLQRIAQASGLDEAGFSACVSSEANLEAVNARSQANAVLGKVEGTPTFVINGVKFEGDATLESLGAAIEAAKRRR